MIHYRFQDAFKGGCHLSCKRYCRDCPVVNIDTTHIHFNCGAFSIRTQWSLLEAGRVQPTGQPTVYGSQLEVSRGPERLTDAG